MASTIPPILIQLQADVTDLKSGLANAEAALKGVDETVKKSTGFFDKFKATFAGVFAADIGTRGLMMVKDLISGSIADAQEYEKIIAQLNAGIKSTGNVAGVTVESMKQLASALESKSAVDEKLILNSQSILQTFTNIRNVAGENNDIFNQATKAALDLSVKMGGDLKGASLQLGKALNDPIRGMTALRRVGVAFTFEQERQIKALMNSGDVMSAQKIILDELAVEFGGAAEAAGSTFAGSIARAKDKVEDFTRDLITNLQPILLSIGSVIGDLINKYLKPLFGFLSDNKEAVLAFVGVIGTAVTAFGIYKGVLAAVNAVQTLFNAIMTANPISLVVVAVAALSAAFVVAWNRSDAFRKLIVQVAEVAVRAFTNIVKVVGNVGVAVLEIVTGPMRTLLTLLSKLPGVGGYAKDALNFITGAIDKLSDGTDSLVKKSENLLENLDELADKKIKLPSFGGETTPAVDQIFGVPATVVTKEAAEAAEKAAEKERKAREAAEKIIPMSQTMSAMALDLERRTMGETVTTSPLQSTNMAGDTVINITGYNLADPNATAQNIVTYAKYGQTVTVLGARPAVKQEAM